MRLLRGRMRARCETNRLVSGRVRAGRARASEGRGAEGGESFTVYSQEDHSNGPATWPGLRRSPRQSRLLRGRCNWLQRRSNGLAPILYKVSPDKGVSNEPSRLHRESPAPFSSPRRRVRGTRRAWGGGVGEHRVGGSGRRVDAYREPLSEVSACSRCPVPDYGNSDVGDAVVALPAGGSDAIARCSATIARVLSRWV